MQNKILAILFLTTIFTLNLSLNLQVKKQEKIIENQQEIVNDIEYCNTIFDTYEQKDRENFNIGYDKYINDFINSYKKVVTFNKYEEDIDISKEIDFINNYFYEKKKLTSKDYIIKEKSKRGSMGRLYIPDVDLNVALFDSGFYDGNSQTIVDNKDSAAYLNDFDIPIIADHKHQGFSKMKQSIPNETLAYINTGDKIETYLCAKKCIGKNTGFLLIDDENRCISVYDEAYKDFGEYIVMYTCNENWQNITITFWKKI